METSNENEKTRKQNREGFTWVGIHGTSAKKAQRESHRHSETGIDYIKCPLERLRTRGTLGLLNVFDLRLRYPLETRFEGFETARRRFSWTRKTSSLCREVPDG